MMCICGRIMRKVMVSNWYECRYCRLFSCIKPDDGRRIQVHKYGEVEKEYTISPGVLILIGREKLL